MQPGNYVAFTEPRLHGDLCDLRGTDPPTGSVGQITDLITPGVVTVDFGPWGYADFLTEELHRWPTPRTPPPESSSCP